jgi:hypothetical protein
MPIPGCIELTTLIQALKRVLPHHLKQFEPGEPVGVTARLNKAGVH